MGSPVTTLTFVESLRKRAGQAALLLIGVSFAAAAPAAPVAAATSTQGGINVEPSARPWQYVGANPDSWWCPSAAQCTTSNPLGRIDTEMALAQQLHVADVRLEIPWFLVEPAKGGYDWARADYIFNSAAGHGIVIQPILVYTPAWAGGYNAFPNPADFGAFVSAFMARYGGRINAVEMWNEPDGGQSLVANNPAQYVQDILIPGYNAVKASHPGVAVIEGGSINDSGTCCPWLSGIYAAGGGNYFDIAAFHDYGGNYGAVTNAYRGLLNAHGQAGKPIWMGEYGVSDATGSQQASLITAALTATPGLAMAQYYTLRDESVYKCCPPTATGEHKQYGVVAADDVTKKSSFQTMQSILGGSSPNPPPAQPPASNPSPSHVAPSPTPTPSPSPSASPTSATAGTSPSHGSGPSSPLRANGSPATAASAAALIVANHLPPGGLGAALELFLVALIVAGLGMAAWGVAFAGDVALFVGPTFTSLRGRRRSALAIGLFIAGIVIAIGAGILLPFR